MARLRPSKQARLGIDLAKSELHLHDQLIAIRKAKGLSQEELAKRIGVERTWVSRFESENNGQPRNHTLDSVRRYALALGAFVAHTVVDAGSPEAGDSKYRELKKSVERYLSQLQGTSEWHETLPIEQTLSDSISLDRNRWTMGASGEWQDPGQHQLLSTAPKWGL